MAQVRNLVVNVLKADGVSVALRGMIRADSITDAEVEQGLNILNVQISHPIDLPENFEIEEVDL